jgi:chemosensory pili system protein ChpE
MMILLISSFTLAIAYCAPPGIVTAETVRRGLSHGFWSAWLVQFGSVLGDATWAVLAIIGLAFLVQNPLLRLLTGMLGVVLLFWLAIQALLGSIYGSKTRSNQKSSRNSFLTGLLLSLSNPFAILFWFGLGGTIFSIIGSNPNWHHYAIFFSGFIAGSIIWCFLIAALVKFGRRFVSKGVYRAVSLICGITLGYFGVQLLLKLIPFLKIVS